ncbi:MmgE/PrpD family protein [Candidatus Halocynthiibacter alkanivorans]|uniref:MmgE/PrpD family protein n=1 Tax=Candidatus Halocynthiibacter alkanivorans TaxID=2267619 RepID=UPI001356A66A|nr:MmgE/PrpD family protein [Candidatus Halocynthiibacter alkanivorans]
MTRDISAEIARFVVTCDGASVPQSARDVMKLSLLDWVAVTRAGQAEPVAEIVRSMVAEEGSTGPCTVAGLEHGLAPRGAALINGTISHALDYDDTHFIYLGHPSVAVVPAALALAEAEGARASEFLEAALIGVEIACRMGDWIGGAHYRKGFHITATAGSFGAAAAASRLLKLNEAQTLTALSIAASRAAGVRAQFGSMGKPYHAGMAASSGVEAAMLAARGFVAADRGLEAPQGFAETHDAAGHDAAFDDLGQRYVFETVQHKFHACCHGLHAALEALTELKSAHSFSPDMVEAVTITVQPRYLTVCNLPAPRSGLEAKFSYRLTTAMALSGHDTARLDSYTDAVCSDPGMTSLRDRVRVKTEEGMVGTVAQVEIVLKNGDRLSAQHDLAHLPDLTTRRAKVRAKASSLLGEVAEASLWSTISGETSLAILNG